MVHPSEREKKLNIFLSNFYDGNFFIIDYDGTILSGCFPKENRNTEGNLLLCPMIITMDSLYFIVFHVQTQKSHGRNRKLDTYFLCLFATLEALGPWLRAVCWNIFAMMGMGGSVPRRPPPAHFTISLLLHCGWSHLHWKKKKKKKLNQQCKQNPLDGYLNPSPSTLDLKYALLLTTVWKDAHLHCFQLLWFYIGKEIFFFPQYLILFIILRC